MVNKPAFSNKDDVARHGSRLKEEIKRCKDSNQWVKDFLSSLK
jgi:hypothetical protein